MFFEQGGVGGGGGVQQMYLHSEAVFGCSAAGAECVLELGCF